MAQWNERVEGVIFTPQLISTPLEPK